MKPHSPSCSPILGSIKALRSTRGGFALIATISMLLLLTVIAVAFLSMSTLTVRSARSDWALEEARANARLALMVAIGELQRELGPDQRVSANAAIMDQSPDTDTIEGVKQPYWVGVWSTEWGDDTEGFDQQVTTPWVRNDETGGLQDLRWSSSNGVYDREAEVRTYLVSGAEGGKRYSSRTRAFIDAVDDGVDNLSEDERVGLVTENSVDDNEKEVEVAKVSTRRFVRSPSGTKVSGALGSYGYWIGDLGVRANVTVTDRHADKNPNPSTESGFERILHHQDINTDKISGLDNYDESVAERLVTPETLKLAEVSDDNLRSYFHDLTTDSSSVISNTRDGGLKKDLHAYINSTDGVIDSLGGDFGPLHYIGIDDDDQLAGSPTDNHSRVMEVTGVNGFDVTSPRMGILRNWLLDATEENFSLVGNEVNLSQSQSAQRLLPEIATMRSDDWTVFDGLLGGISRNPGPNDGGLTRVLPGGGVRGQENFPMKLKALDQPSFVPIVTEASLYYNLAEELLTRRVSQDSDAETEQYWQLYVCLYPRVALWNPWNVEMEVPPLIMQLFVNGNKRARVQFEGPLREISIPFGKRFGGGESFRGERKILPFHGGLGQTFWTLARSSGGGTVTIPPGETVVFTPDPARSTRGTGDYSSSQFYNNLLTPRNEPSPQRFYYEEITKGTHTGGGNVTRDLRLDPLRAISYTEFARGNSNQTGADNAQFLVKYKPGSRRLPRSGRLSVIEPSGESFSEDWQALIYSNVSLQIGGSDELPIRTRDSNPGFVHLFIKGNGRPARLAQGQAEEDTFTPPDFTRDGYRLRFFQETSSNLQPTSRFDQQDMERLFETAPLANWNMRLSFNSRNPLDNITDVAPYFFGIYTRDVPGGDISFDEMNTVPGSAGQQAGYPFSPPQRAPSNKLVLFEAPTAKIGIPSLAYLRHLKLSEVAWHPSYAIGNSLADPKILPHQTAMDWSDNTFSQEGGWNWRTIGWNSQRSRGGVSGADRRDYWARLLREALQSPRSDNYLEQNHLVYDMSYETNFNLWDTYFLSTGTNDEKRRFVENPKSNPLPNGRFVATGNQDTLLQDLSGEESFFRAASRLMLKGGFNVNSTSKEAWKAVLASSEGAGLFNKSGISFPRFLNPAGTDNAAGADYELDESVQTGNRVITDSELDDLATQMVVQVKRRAPFLGLSDFVNRRLSPFESVNAQRALAEPPLYRDGAIEQAIFLSGINNSLNLDPYRITWNEGEIEGGVRDTAITDPTRLDHRLKPYSKLWGMPGYLTQGDVLGVIGSGLRSRSDTFVVRAYGESKNINGKILARAWCEATVQRTPEPLNPDRFGLNPEITNGDQVDFGRRFRMIGFRWLDSAEV